MTDETLWTALGTIVAILSLIGWFLRNFKKDMLENFKEIKENFDKINTRFDKIEEKLANIDNRLSVLEIRVDERTFRINHYSTGTEEQG